MAKNKLENEEEQFVEGERFFIETDPEATRDVRRKGAGFDTLGNILRGLKELSFSNAFKIVNRPGRKINPAEKLATGLVNVKNAFELFYAKISNEGIQSIIFGRQGDGNYRFTNLIDITATHNTAIGSKEGRNNGYIKLRVTRDDENPESDRSGVNIYDPGTVNDVGLEGVVIQVVGQGKNGGVVISYITDKANSPTSGVPYILVDSDGIQIFGGVQFVNLPVGNPGGPSGRLYRDSTSSGSLVRVT